jgi:hypothetical protein
MSERPERRNIMSVASPAAAVRSRPLLATGAVAGILGAVAMAGFAMIASATYHGVGFFTPMYHIASSLIAPDAMMTSAGQAMAGNIFYFAAGPALLGFGLHLAVGAVFGTIFALLIAALGVRGPALVPVGIVYGALVLALMSFVGLPIAASIFGGGDPIRDMPSMAGWWTFTIEHLLFGAVLGLWFVRPSSSRLRS